MFSFAKLVAFTALAVSQVAAHGGVLSYGFGGTIYQGWQPYDSPTGQTSIQRPWSSYNPIQGATTASLSCNDDGTAGALQLTATVPAGTEITAYWNQVWPHPYGPQLTYLAACPSSGCTGVNSNTLQWFKIDESGLLSGTVYAGSWGAGQMIAQNSSWTTKIPTTVPSGYYMIRFETIALHSMPAQFYPECAQIEITNGGTLAPTAAELVTFPGGYSDTDPGLDIDIYSNEAQTTTTYTIPGPPLYGSASSGSAAPPPPPPASSAPAPASSAPAPASSAPVPAPSTVTGAAHYAQCGGTGFSGPDTCASPYTCTYSNAYYSQCL